MEAPSGDTGTAELWRRLLHLGQAPVVVAGSTHRGEEATVLDALTVATTRAAAALGLSEGPVHAELRIGAGGEVTMLELAARSIGGLCSRALRFGAGVSLEEVILRQALGLGLDGLEREAQASGVMMLPIRSGGILERVTGQDEALSVEGIVGVEISIVAGRPVVPLPEGDRYLGFVFARGATAEDVEGALRRAERCLRVELRRTAARQRIRSGQASP